MLGDGVLSAAETTVCSESCGPRVIAGLGRRLCGPYLALSLTGGPNRSGRVPSEWQRPLQTQSLLFQLSGPNHTQALEETHNTNWQKPGRGPEEDSKCVFRFKGRNQRRVCAANSGDWKRLVETDRRSLSQPSASGRVNKAVLAKGRVSIHHLHVGAQSIKTHKEIFAFSL